MKLHDRYEYLKGLLERAKEEYKKNHLFSTELEIVSLEEECRQLLSKINKEEQYLHLRESFDFYSFYPSIKESVIDTIKKVSDKIDLPIDVRKIAISCGFDKIELNDGGLSGKHASVINNIIYVNRNEPDEEQRFSIAHEIGHKILDNHKNTVEEVARKGNRWKEDVLSQRESIPIKEAEKLLKEEIIDYFAANLLMPTCIFKEWLGQSDEIITSKFRVSEKSVQKRRREVIQELDGSIKNVE
jgi:Zn-dependent peptidase ImmA (M78 family)